MYRRRSGGRRLRAVTVPSELPAHRILVKQRPFGVGAAVVEVRSEGRDARLLVPRDARGGAAHIPRVLPAAGRHPLEDVRGDDARDRVAEVGDPRGEALRAALMGREHGGVPLVLEHVAARRVGSEEVLDRRAARLPHVAEVHRPVRRREHHRPARDAHDVLAREPSVPHRAAGVEDRIDGGELGERPRPRHTLVVACISPIRKLGAARTASTIGAIFARQLQLEPLVEERGRERSAATPWACALGRRGAEAGGGGGRSPRKRVARRIGVRNRDLLLTARAVSASHSESASLFHSPGRAAACFVHRRPA